MTALDSQMLGFSVFLKDFFFQNLFYLCSGRLQCKTIKPSVTQFLSNMSLCYSYSVTSATQKFKEIEFNKNLFQIMEKYFISFMKKKVIIDISCNFLYFWSCLKNE